MLIANKFIFTSIFS